MGTRHFQARRKRALAVSDYHLVKMTSLVFRLVFVGQTQFKTFQRRKKRLRVVLHYDKPARL